MLIMCEEMYISLVVYLKIICELSIEVEDLFDYSHVKGSERMEDTKSKPKGKYLKENPGKKHRRKKNKLVPVLVGLAVVLAAGLLLMVAGLNNQSAYQKIVRDGYSGTQEQWLASLVGEETDSNADTSFELAVRNGYKGSEPEWIKALLDISIESVDASPYKLACENGFEGSLVEWLTSIADNPEVLGQSESAEQKTEYELACEYGYDGTFIEWLISVTHDRVFE